ncbi:histidine phosphatase family protein [Bifidobacterium sp. ESL0769]|uniref:histidine phosphatase family protein n=1 Tax=Bifidobacterium sp. ESL0769 TaxID=2983229 RepID=UPI0023F64C2B|nr:histidine phosphatase family protein [Bifidobacterium sp. ESL0769]WEV67625.1 histidine phosphatase family protein [Bifidobacterium sp. ESL0769]
MVSAILLRVSWETSLQKDTNRTGKVVLLRHGQTVWAETGQYTGRTDIPLTQEGEQQARDAGERLRRQFPNGFESDYVFSSPLQRSRKTAELAGFTQYHLLPDIMEWDYGRAEGRSPQQINTMLGREWSLWDEGSLILGEAYEGDREEQLPDGEIVNVHNGRGETLDEVAQRARGVIAQIEPMAKAGHDVLLVAHAHIIRILASQWLGLDPHFAKLIRMGTAHYSVLDLYKGYRVIDGWNL